MDLIDRYVYAVTRHLPEKQRSDVARELTSTIEEMVSVLDTSKDIQREAKIKKVLLDLGDPDVFAAQYQEKKQYLIGPQFFDSYTTLLRNLLLIVPITVAAVTVIVGLVQTYDMGRLLLNALGAAFTVAIHIFLWLTLIFVWAEHSGKTLDSPKTKPTAAWSPDSLPAVPHGPRIPRSEAIGGIVWSALAILGTLWQIPAIHAVIAPDIALILSETVWPHWAIALLAISVASLIGEIVRLKVGVWNKLTVRLIIALDGIVATVFLLMLVFFENPINQAFVDSVARNDNAALVGQIANNGFTIFCLTMIGICIYESIRAVWIYKHTKHRRLA